MSSYTTISVFACSISLFPETLSVLSSYSYLSLPHALKISSFDTSSLSPSIFLITLIHAGNSFSTFISIFVSTISIFSSYSFPPSSNVKLTSSSLNFALATYFFCRKICKDAAYFLFKRSLVAFNLQ